MKSRNCVVMKEIIKYINILHNKRSANLKCLLLIMIIRSIDNNMIKNLIIKSTPIYSFSIVQLKRIIKY